MTAFIRLLTLASIFVLIEACSPAAQTDTPSQTQSAIAFTNVAVVHLSRDAGIAEGHRADLLLLRQNPLDNSLALTERAGVMVAGKWYDRATIDARLSAIKQAYSTSSGGDMQ